VPDKVAEELADLPQYFTVAFDGRKAGARATPQRGQPAEPTASF